MAEHWDAFNGNFKRILEENYLEYLVIQEKIFVVDDHIKNPARTNEQCNRLQEINRVGPLTAQLWSPMSMTRNIARMAVRCRCAWV